jgi:hypothetical protein
MLTPELNAFLDSLAIVQWENILNKPDLADSNWRSPVADVASLPTLNNVDGDLRLVLDTDTVYTWDVNHWKIVGASSASIEWASISDKPTTFIPTIHAHAISDITGLQTALNGKVDDSQVLTNVPAGALFTDTIYTHPGSHPASMITPDANRRFVTDAQITAWDGAVAGTYVHPASHPQSMITNLVTDLAAKAPLSHGHTVGEITGTVSDTMLGNRTVDQSIVTAFNNTGTLTQIASWLAKSIKNISGETNWSDAPTTNLKNHLSAHAPSNAQKNSDITKAEIEAKLTGELSSHTHPPSGAVAGIAFKQQDFTATASQKVFTLTGGNTYLPANNRMMVYAGGVYVPASGFTETNTTTVTLTAGVDVGTIVTLRWLQPDNNDLKGDQGIPGYTPVKGVDYFDGAASTVPGPKGDPGADSIVPGPKGDTGEQGPQGPSGVINNYNAKLASDVQLAVTGTWYNGPSVDLPAGTWLVIGNATVGRTTTTALKYVLRLSTGTVHYASAETYMASAVNHWCEMTVQSIIVLAATTTVRLQATTTSGATGNLMKAATADYGSGANATQISAIRLA